ncbi:MAG: META domain-containing protein [Dehalococcoidales bacterium]|nr:MAG: META domain-containing protein [Dehalococcoidales bacterium]
MKRYSLLLIVLMVALILAFTGCGSSSADEIEDTKWVLESYGDRDNPQDVIEGTEITATFNSEDNQVTGSAGCNHYFGGYEINDGLSVDMLAHTEMWCEEPEGRMDQETEYLTILQAAQSYTVKDSTLTIDCGDDVLIYTESEAAN